MLNVVMSRINGEHLNVSCGPFTVCLCLMFSLPLSSHGATRRREVKVQLLDPGPAQTSSQDAVGVASVRSEAGSSAGRPEDDADAAAAAHPIKVGLCSCRCESVSTRMLPGD